MFLRCLHFAVIVTDYFIHEVYKEGNYINARYQAVAKIVSLKRCRTCRSRVKFCCLPLTNYTLETLMTRYTRHKKDVLNAMNQYVTGLFHNTCLLGVVSDAFF